MPAILSAIYTTVTALMLFLGVIAFSLRLLDVATGQESKERLRQRILNFWIETSALAVTDQLHRSLEARYARMKPLRWTFLKGFWILCIVVALSSVAPILKLSPDERAQSLKNSVAIDFGLGYVTRCASKFSQEKQDDLKKLCDAKNKERAPKELQVYVQRENRFNAYVAQMGKWEVLTSQLGTLFLSIALVALPVSAALVISFNFTLWLLRRVTRSKLRFAFLVLIDLLIAISAPPVLTSFCLIVLFGFQLFATGQIVDLSIFDSANWGTLTVGLATFYTNTGYVVPVVSLAIGYFTMGFIGSTLLAFMFLLAPIWMGFFRISSFATATIQFLNFDFTNAPLEAVIDWAVFTDLLFSVCFLAPSLLMVLANRSEGTRNAFLNVVMYIGDHKEGPYAATAGIFASVGEFLKNIFSGKR